MQESKKQNLILSIIIISLLTALLTIWLNIQPKTPEFNQIQRVLLEGELRVATVIGPSTYYENESGIGGVDFITSMELANSLGVKLKMLPVNNLDDMFSLLDSGKAHMAASSLTSSENRENKYLTAKTFQTVDEYLIYRRNQPKPSSINDVNKPIEVKNKSSHAEYLAKLKQKNPHLKIVKTNLSTTELLDDVSSHKIPYTVIDSNQFMRFQRFYPELAIALTLRENQPIVWLFPKENIDIDKVDNSLQILASKILQSYEDTGKAAHLMEKYYGHLETFDYVDTHFFLRRANSILPKYREIFEEVSSPTIPWELLAATSYQESHWNPSAKSATGVRGLMMLTLKTAKEVGVNNRLDPVQSIVGGGKYLHHLINRLNSEVTGNDRYWLALAAYNIGYGHLQDARRLTKNAGKDPNQWLHVKEFLPLLQQKEWYSQTRYGRARGNEALHYVENIRRYYDLLVWHQKNSQELVASN